MRLNPSGEKPTKRKNNIVVDTGVLVSAFAFGASGQGDVDDLLI